MEKQCQEFYIIKFRTDFWWQLTHGGNKYRNICINTIIPPITFDKYIGTHKNKRFGHNNKELRFVTKWGIETTETSNGQ